MRFEYKIFEKFFIVVVVVCAFYEAVRFVTLFSNLNSKSNSSKYSKYLNELIGEA